MKIFAHRGASGEQPENTLLAINAALNMHVDGIEIDVHRVENELIVIHDRWLQTTTNGVGRLDKQSFTDIRRLDAGKSQKVPTLWEVLSLVNGQCTLNIELKSEYTVELLLPLLEQATVQLEFTKQQLLISSFNFHLLAELYKQSPNWPIGALTATRPIEYALCAQNLKAQSVHIDIEVLNQAFVDDAHARGLLVYVYTVDFAEDIEDLYLMKVDGIFTNLPLIAKDVIARLKS